MANERAVEKWLDENKWANTCRNVYAMDFELSAGMYSGDAREIYWEKLLEKLIAFHKKWHKLPKEVRMRNEMYFNNQMLELRFWNP